jgi:hypothetical protein
MNFLAVNYSWMRGCLYIDGAEKASRCPGDLATSLDATLE